ncbi:MAG: hypothetical protein LBQ84_02780 [Flavobacteriaceae bacterium]|jgi:4-amino-4-deoxy-L-arabinose transferase-like glycosyltransferase|nr:hypothetical protein [Flavobacteriaceae bacterium]
MRNNLDKQVILLFFVSLIILGVNLGIFPVNIMEARNFITAREMVQDDNWILTTLNGEPRYEKPPLPTWLTAVLGLVFGFDSVAVLRVAVVLTTFLLVFYIYKLSLKLGLSGRNSFHNGLILLTSFYIYFAGRDNQWDMYCHSFMIVSIYYLWNILRLNKEPVKNAVIGGLFLSFSILSKGPVSIYALFFPFLLAYGWVYKFELKKNKKYLKALLIYLSVGIAVGVSWSVYVRWADPVPLAEVAKKETSRWINDYNSKSFFYYWNFFIQSGIWSISALLALIYPYMKSRVSDLKAYKFTLIWTLASLILLSIIPEKKVRYILPVLIPMALTTGFYVEYMISGLKTKTDKIIAVFHFGLLGFIGISYSPVLFFVFKEKISGQMLWAVLSSVSMFIMGVVIFYYLKRNNFKKVLYSLVALQCVIIIFAFPLAKSFLHNPRYRSVKELHRFTGDKMTLYDYKYMSPEIVWDYGEKVPYIDDAGIEKQLVKLNKDYIGILCFEKDTDKLIKNWQKKYNVRKVSYLDLNTVSPDNKDYKDRLTRNFLIVFKKNY